jgi:hypothetical protein
VPGIDVAVASIVATITAPCPRVVVKVLRMRNPPVSAGFLNVDDRPNSCTAHSFILLLRET